MECDELLSEARSRTGLEDFGEDSYREGLERLVRSLNTESRLNEIGKMSLRELILGLLTQRLQVEDWYRRHPEIEDEPIEAPLIGMSLPRTGSTALSFLLAEDPNARSLRRWEGTEPCPPPSTVEGRDPRIAKAESATEIQLQVSPRAAALVPSTPEGPYECQHLMGLSFKAQFFEALAHTPSYSHWLHYDADLTSTYLYERRVLKLLQWGEPRPRPWRLKCPSHLAWLPALDTAFPDARFVMTHRDPVDVIVSVADLYVEIGVMMNESLDLEYIGRSNVEKWSTSMERAIAFRDAGNDHRFYDMHFRAVQKDPIGEVKKLYAWLGEPVTPEFEEGMRRWWSDNAENRTPNVHPDPASFGIDLDQVRPLFANYVERMEKWTAH